MTEPALRQMSNAIDAGVTRSTGPVTSTAFVLGNAKFRGAWLAQVPNTHLARRSARYIDHVQVIRLQTLSQRHGSQRCARAHEHDP